jgi:hypothetical protein
VVPEVAGSDPVGRPTFAFLLLFSRRLRCDIVRVTMFR